MDFHSDTIGTMDNISSLLSWSSISPAREPCNGSSIANSGARGIKKELFVGTDHEMFICPVCSEVALNPVLSSCCESAYCSQCFDSSMKAYADSCKGCNLQVIDGITAMPFQKQASLVYQRLLLQCPNCDHELTIRGFHDHVCDRKKFSCISCGFKENILEGQEHDCVEWLKNEKRRLETELSFVEQERMKDAEGFMIEIERLKNLLSNEGHTDGTVSDTGSRGVIFDDDETIAWHNVQVRVSDAIARMTRSGKTLAENMKCFREVMNEGGWTLFTRDCLSQSLQNFSIDPTTFCSFTFDGRKYIVFKRGRSERGRRKNNLSRESTMLLDKIKQFSQ